MYQISEEPLDPGPLVEAVRRRMWRLRAEPRVWLTSCFWPFSGVAASSRIGGTALADCCRGDRRGRPVRGRRLRWGGQCMSRAYAIGGVMLDRWMAQGTRG